MTSSASKPNASTASAVIPLTFGIVGHRDIHPDDIDWAKQMVGTILQNYRKRYPNTPIIFMSALAESADHIAADAALEVEGVSLAAILPMAVDEYISDFKNPEARLRFDLLLKKSRWKFETDDGCPANDRWQRDNKYQACGQYIAKHSHILFVFWNGENNNLIGGTADIVNFKLRGCIDHNTSADKYTKCNETGFVIHVPVRRLSSTFVPKTRAVVWLPASARNGVFKNNNAQPNDKIALALEQFNEERLVKAAILDGRTKTLHDTAGKLAVKYRNRSARFTAWIFCLSIIVLLATQLEEKSHAMPALMLEVLLITVVWSLWAYVHKWRIKTKYEDYRGLCEASRIQIYWNMSGIRDCVADDYLSAQSSELDWLRRALRTVAILDAWENKYSADLKNNYVQVVKHEWLENQSVYFDGSGNKRGAIATNLLKAERVAISSRVFLFSAGIAILATSAGKALSWLELGRSVQGINAVAEFSVEWGGMITAGGLAMFTATKAYGELMAYASHSKRYESLSLIYRRALEAFSIWTRSGKEVNEQELRSLLIIVGKQALTENENWLITKRDRELRPL